MRRAEYPQEAAPDVSTHVQRRLSGWFQKQADHAVPGHTPDPHRRGDRDAGSHGRPRPSCSCCCSAGSIPAGGSSSTWHGCGSMLAWMLTYCSCATSIRPRTRSRPCTWTSRTRSRAASTGSSRSSSGCWRCPTGSSSPSWASSALVVTVIGWLLIIITGSYPRGMFDFVVGVMRWALRVEAYAVGLMTDQYPPFRLAE